MVTRAGSKFVNAQRTRDAANYVSSSGGFPVDGSIPQISEGSAGPVLVYTPKRKGSTVLCQVVIPFNAGASTAAQAAIFVDGSTDAKDAKTLTLDGSFTAGFITLQAEAVSTGAAITFTVRIGMPATFAQVTANSPDTWGAAVCTVWDIIEVMP